MALATKEKWRRCAQRVAELAQSLFDVAVSEGCDFKVVGRMQPIAQSPRLRGPLCAPWKAANRFPIDRLDQQACTLELFILLAGLRWLPLSCHALHASCG